jgi:hypothetical protein
MKDRKVKQVLYGSRYQWEVVRRRRVNMVMYFVYLYENTTKQ